jgi:hypothetical protein
MYRSLFPFILASIGFALIVLAKSMPLFEWQISEFHADFPSIYEVDALPSPWIARLGDSLNDKSYVFGRVSVSRQNEECIKDDLYINVKRSSRDKSLDQAWLKFHENLSWLAGWSWIAVVISIIYILCFVLGSRQGSTLKVMLLTGTALILFLNLTQILRLVAPYPFPPSYSFGTAKCDHGTITFGAKLLKIHYQTMVILLIGIFSELAIPLTMWYQIKQVIDRKIR